MQYSPDQTQTFYTPGSYKIINDYQKEIIDIEKRDG